MGQIVELVAGGNVQNAQLCHGAQARLAGSIQSETDQFHFRRSFPLLKFSVFLRSDLNEIHEPSFPPFRRKWKSKSGVPIFQGFSPFLFRTRTLDTPQGGRNDHPAVSVSEARQRGKEKRAKHSRSLTLHPHT
jgi:hypothetical protein